MLLEILDKLLSIYLQCFDFLLEVHDTHGGVAYKHLHIRENHCTFVVGGCTPVIDGLFHDSDENTIQCICDCMQILNIRKVKSRRTQMNINITWRMIIAVFAGVSHHLLNCGYFSISLYLYEVRHQFDETFSNPL